jgi:hypothetical protein
MGRSDPKKRSNGATPYQRFEDLTKRLLSVPKDEADAKAAEQKRRKNKTR